MNGTDPHGGESVASRAPTRDVPKRFRGPFTRWPRGADAVLAAVMLLLTVLVEESPGEALVLRPVAAVPAPVLVLFAVAGGALYLRRRAPLVTLSLVIAAWSPTLGGTYATAGGCVIVALYSTGRYAADTRRGRAGTAVGVAAAIAAVVIDGLLQSTPWGDIGVGIVVMAAAWYIGRRVRMRAERAARIRREQVAEARRIVAEERTHIARELHDVVAHRVSMMTVQAGAARMVAADDPQGALEAMVAVEEAGRQALDELRHLLGVLRPSADRDGLGPQPGLADLGRLVAQVREAGLDVSVTGGLGDPLPARVELSVYRIVQEALTNVLKHSGPGTCTDVHVRREPSGGRITVEVLDDGRGAGAVRSAAASGRPATAGHGIVGMRERALLLGGSLDAGPRPDGGFRVVARLPLGGEPE
ncbi:sensor histidine kinase [Streptomyces sp. MUM 203J]|uniref:sensor histidine kinase n=1 Tax=Streptomyces sp. MUM 203J TaxID=2791990 RepID=UPI001F046B68|nr:sensor histidine kinase [Streptomyces sp. MUM 203J]MCH0539256.1 sensor histidine kinase [Streptomyces sp. MUM 203J]